MNRLFSLILLMSTLLFAQSMPIQNVTAVETSNEFIVAQSQYKLGDYTSSYQQFKKLFLKHTDNAQVNFYLAMSAMELKLYDEATAAFERVLIVQPDFHRARLEFARLQFLLGFKEEAKKEFLKVAEYPISSNLRKSIDSYLEQIDSTKVNSTFIALGLGYMYDNNINSGINYNSYTLPGYSNFSVNADKPQSSTSYLTSFQINHIQSFEKDSPFSIKHIGTLFYKNQTENDKYNFSYYSYTPVIFYNDAANKMEYSVKLGIERILPGDSIDFSTYSVIPKYKILINQDTDVSVFLGYNEFHYEHNIDKNKNFSKKFLGGTIKFKDFKYTVQFEEDNKEFSSRTDLNKNIFTNTFFYQYMIQPSLFVNLKYQYKETQYNEQDIYFANNREDHTNIYNISIIKIIDKKDFINLSYTKTNNSTNQKAYDYNKNSVVLNYTWRFQL